MTASRLVTSLTNPAVKAARALHLRKSREADGLFLAEGLKIVIDAIDLGRAPRVLMHGDMSHPLLDRAGAFTRAHGGEVLHVTPEILAKISRRDNPQTVVGVFAQEAHDLSTLDPTAADVWVALQAVRDPGNLGTIIRTADAAGCGGVVLVGECCDPFSVEAVRATMGSIFAVPIYVATDAAFLAWRPSWPGTLVGTHLNATTDYRATKLSRPTMVLLGNESHGLPPAFAETCDVNVKIPMRGRADSLNLSVAAGVMIYGVGD